MTELINCMNPRLDAYEWEKLKDKVKKRDSNKCVKCGSTKGLEIDHKTPLRLGGSNSLDNLQTLCKKCHTKKTKEDVTQIKRVRFVNNLRE